MLRARIAGTGSYLPERRLTNRDLEGMVDTSDEWIVTRTGIRERHIAAQSEVSSDMASEASRRALEMAGVKAEELDMIILGTVTPDMPMPSTACFVQQKLGAHRACAFDLSAACAGFLYGLSIGNQFIMTGRCGKVLVIGVEMLSKVLDWTDRNTCVLFGDGAGAVVLVPSKEGRGVLSTHIRSDGRLWDILNIPGGGTRHPASPDTVSERLHYVKMQGREVFKHAVRNLAEVTLEALRYNDLRTSDIDLVLAHQANMRILDAVAGRIGIPLEKFHLNIERYGNTSSASVPITLDEVNRAGRLNPGDLLLFNALGAGLAWGAAVVRW